MSSHVKLLELINTSNPNSHPLSIGSVTFSDPVVDDGFNWNTKVIVSSVPGSGYYGNVDVNYSRIALSKLGTAISLISEIPFTIETIVSMLNIAKNTFLSVDDLDTIDITSTVIGDIETIVLTARSNSLGWLGSTPISLLYGLSDNTDILHTLMNITLPSGGYLI